MKCGQRVKYSSFVKIHITGHSELNELQMALLVCKCTIPVTNCFFFFFCQTIFEFGSTIKIIVNGYTQSKSKRWNVGGATRVGLDVMYNMVRQLSELIA